MSWGRSEIDLHPMLQDVDEVGEAACQPHADELVADESSWSLLDECSSEAAENEKCKVSNYRTTAEQRRAILKQMITSDRKHFPIEWVIDIADESNTWFFGTAYGWNDVTHQVHVMIPDKKDPTFSGWVQLDHRTVRLVECVDNSTHALFNKIMRDSIIKVKWDVETFDDTSLQSGQSDMSEKTGEWYPSVAKYYIRIGNQVLLEEFEEGKKFLVMVSADSCLRLLRCVGNKGIEDFANLIADGVVEASDEAQEQALQASQTQSYSVDNATISAPRQLVELARTVKDLILKEELRHKKLNEETLRFIVDGDLDAGQRLLEMANDGLNDGTTDENQPFLNEALQTVESLESHLLCMLDEGADTNAIEEWERKCAKLKKENDKLKQYLQETEKENNHLRRRTKS